MGIGDCLSNISAPANDHDSGLSLDKFVLAVNNGWEIGADQIPCFLVDTTSVRIKSVTAG